MFNKIKTMFKGTSTAANQILSAFSSSYAYSGRRSDSFILDSYDKSPWLHAIVNKIAFAVASVELEFYDSKGNLLEDHPAKTLIDNMNPILTPLQNKMLLSSYIELIGRAYLLAERDSKNRIVELYPVNPKDIIFEPRLNDTHYKISIGTNVLDVPKEDVIKIFNPSPSDPTVKGTGLGTVTTDEVESDEYAAKYIKAYFNNAARPDIIVTAQGLKKEDTERLEHKWNDKLKGVFNAHKTFFLNRQIDITRLDTSFKDMDMVELRKFLRDEMINTAAIPPELFGVLSSSNRGTISHAEHIFNTQVIKPRINLIIQSLQKFVIDKSYPGVTIKHKPFIIGDRDFEFSVMNRFPQAFTMEEVRKLVGKTGTIEPEDSIAENDKKPEGNPTPRQSEDPVVDN